MRLPNAELAIVERGKIVDYLLNLQHPIGASKARFFARYGFNAREWARLAAALKEHGQTNEVTGMRETGYGVVYQIDGELVATDGRSAMLRTVWQAETGAVAPRLIAAYPLSGERL